MNKRLASLPNTLSDWLALLEFRRPETTIRLGLEHMAHLKHELDFRFDCPIILVAGTNGKGSTCAMLESIFLRAGYRTGVYTQPHFLHFNERARINGEFVVDACFLPHFEAVEKARDQLPLTWFEFTTLAITRLLASAQLDVVILEIGLGGRLDAVNIFDPDVAIVTSIGIDHIAQLGSSRESIAAEKAGIFRFGKVAICGDPSPPATLIEQAQTIGASLWRMGHEFTIEAQPQQWHYFGRYHHRHALSYPALRGQYQLRNAAAALAACEALHEKLPVSAQAIRMGLMMVNLPGRFQVLPGRVTQVLDVAHNPEAASVLANNLAEMGFYPTTHAVFGCMRDKDLPGILACMQKTVDHWYFTDLPSPRAASAHMIAQQLVGDDTVDDNRPLCFDTPTQALQAAQNRAHDNDRIVVFGSFLTIAGVIATRHLLYGR